MPDPSSRAVDSSAVEIAYETAPWRCTPCNSARCGASPTPLIIVLLVALNWIPVVIFTLGHGVNAGRVVGVVLFHFALVFMFLAWFYTCCTDPGTPPETWQREMSNAAARGDSVPICRRSGLYSAICIAPSHRPLTGSRRILCCDTPCLPLPCVSVRHPEPPRSHFDSVTERLTLNMDHFCPWVVNTVGFYNRKFFMLFLVYANLTMLVACVYLLVQVTAHPLFAHPAPEAEPTRSHPPAHLAHARLPSPLARAPTQAPQLWPWLQDEDSGAPTRYFPSMINILIYGGAIALDGVLVFCVLGPFMMFHLRMAAHNETTIEGSSNAQFDVGVLQNLRSVFGRQMWTWPIPLYLNGPDGDGLHWPSTRDGGLTRAASRTSVTPSGALPAP